MIDWAIETTPQKRLKSNSTHFIDSRSLSARYHFNLRDYISKLIKQNLDIQVKTSLEWLVSAIKECLKYISESGCDLSKYLYIQHLWSFSSKPTALHSTMITWIPEYRIYLSPSSILPTIFFWTFIQNILNPTELMDILSVGVVPL